MTIDSNYVWYAANTTMNLYTRIICRVANLGRKLRQETKNTKNQRVGLQYIERFIKMPVLLYLHTVISFHSRLLEVGVGKPSLKVAPTTLAQGTDKQPK